MQNNNIEIAKRFFQMLPYKNWDSFVDIVDENAKFCAVTFPEIKTVKEYINLHQQLYSFLPDIKLNIDLIFGNEDKVFLRYIGEGSHSGNPYVEKRKSGSIPPSKKRAHWTASIFLVFRNNKIIHIIKEWDKMTMWHQLGWPIRDVTYSAETFAKLPFNQFKLSEYKGLESLGMTEMESEREGTELRTGELKGEKVKGSETRPGELKGERLPSERREVKGSEMRPELKGEDLPSERREPVGTTGQMKPGELKGERLPSERREPGTTGQKEVDTNLRPVSGGGVPSGEAGMRTTERLGERISGTEKGTEKPLETGKGLEKEKLREGTRRGEKPGVTGAQ